MKPALATDTKPVLRFTRVALMLSIGFAFIAGIQLYILSDHTDQYFAWTIAQPLSAAFLGGVYWAGVALFSMALTEQAWSHARLAVVAVSVIVVILLITTLLHLDRFHFQAADLRPFLAAWVWMIIYLAFPVLLLLVFIFQRRTSGGDVPRTALLSRGARVMIACNVVFALLVFLALFFDPQALFSIWPWQLTALTAQAISGGFLSIAAASLQMLRENAWERNRAGGVSYLVFGLLQLIALARYAGTVEWGRPATWVYLFFLGTVVYGGIYLILHTRGPLTQRAQLAKQ